jgi:Domain of unknown function DUF29
LREARVDEFDLANLIEEIEAMARSDKKTIKSDLVVLLTHLLKHQLQPEQRSSGWRGSIVEHRRRLRYDFEESPSLLRHAAEVFASAYADAREQASAETGLWSTSLGFRNIFRRILCGSPVMINAEATTKKRVYRNYRTAVPQYYREK